jgi:hypothetical protein
MQQQQDFTPRQWDVSGSDWDVKETLSGCPLGMSLAFPQHHKDGEKSCAAMT